MRKIWMILLVLAALAIGFAGGSRMRPERIVTTTIHDTTIVHDTLTEIRPEPVTTYIHDSLKMTIVLHEVDTQYIYLPHEYKRYKTDSYDATISGYQPVLESISVYPETRFVTTVVTEPAKATRWGLGCQLGYGVSRDGLSPYFGIGISYNLINF